MTSPEESIGQARVFACACAKKKKSLNEEKTALFICSGSTQQRLHKDVPTPAPPHSLFSSQRHATVGPECTPSFLKNRPPWPLTYSICAALRPPHSPRWLCRGPTVRDAQSPSVTLTFHLHKDRHDTAPLCSLVTSSPVLFVSGKKKRWWMPKTNFSFLLLLVNSSLCLPTRRFKGTPGCLLHVNSLVLLYALHRCLDWFRFIPSKQLLISTLSLYAIWKHAETYL